MPKVIPKVQIRLKRAKQAKKLREKGYTLAEIARVMGYKSINSVVYLLKWYEKQTNSKGNS